MRVWPTKIILLYFVSRSTLKRVKPAEENRLHVVWEELPDFRPEVDGVNEAREAWEAWKPWSASLKLA